MLQFIKRTWMWFWAPTARFAWGAIIFVGFIGGIIFWGGFNTAMEATNSLKFCISCHEMEQLVYVEYKESTHYQNASGVRAICSDCHVPHEWTPKLIRKIRASGEVWGMLIGKIDTIEEFEEHRWEMANNVWRMMEATDSRECRNCHSFEAMDFTLQSRRASEKMQEGHEQGETCITCHKGIAHKMPVDPNAPERDD
ncbi:MAG: NapC/NirT family cytochrome c [Rhodobacteraceae bacterium]|nr:NapC/NirT family cytochrome c [Paracoccaceae bacterium]